MILVPVKNLENAKERLSPVLDRAERRALAEAMLLDVLEALTGLRRYSAVALVTSDSFAISLARQHRFEVIDDPINRSETDAVAQGTQFCITHGHKWMLVVPGDIPLVQISDLEDILAAAPEEGSLLVPGCDGRGTNAVFRRPADLFPLRFGNDSFQPHLRAAQATGTQCVVLHLERIGLDVDAPADLTRLLFAAGNTRSQRLLRAWQTEKRALAANE
jgi:2-phospho-L-lactate guanylyltransferase